MGFDPESVKFREAWRAFAADRSDTNRKRLRAAENALLARDEECRRQLVELLDELLVKADATHAVMAGLRVERAAAAAEVRAVEARWREVCSAVRPMQPVNVPDVAGGEPGGGVVLPTGASPAASIEEELLAARLREQEAKTVLVAAGRDLVVFDDRYKAIIRHLGGSFEFLADVRRRSLSRGV